MLTIPTKMSLDETLAYLEQMRKYYVIEAEMLSKPDVSDVLRKYSKSAADTASEYAQLHQWLSEYKEIKLRKTTSIVDNIDVYD
jgi:hypothetical protein